MFQGGTPQRFSKSEFFPASCLEGRLLVEKHQQRRKNTKTGRKIFPVDNTKYLPFVLFCGGIVIHISTEKHSYEKAFTFFPLRVYYIVYGLS